MSCQYDMIAGTPHHYLRGDDIAILQSVYNELYVFVLHFKVLSLCISIECSRLYNLTQGSVYINVIYSYELFCKPITYECTHVYMYTFYSYIPTVPLSL